ncbi:MAG: DUF2726 domain-containing protein [Betaproteobacteria bacterium]
MNATSLKCNNTDTLVRLAREMRFLEASQFLRDQCVNLISEPDFSDVFKGTFIPMLVRAYANTEATRTLSETTNVVWQIVDAYKLYPDEPWLSILKDNVLPSIELVRGQEAAFTLACKQPYLPGADEYRSRWASIRASRQPVRKTQEPVIRMERRFTVSDYKLGDWESSNASALSAKKTLLRSPQEREFLKAARMFFIGREVLPNVPLRNFIRVDRLFDRLDNKMQRYAQLSEADVLIASPVDFDPLGVIELDSAYHDQPVAKIRDAMKGRLLELAEIPFVRLRAEPIKAVSAEDFYALLQDQWGKFEAFKAARWRERETHGALLPAA